jgi:hypothetical protein
MNSPIAMNPRAISALAAIGATLVLSAAGRADSSDQYTQVQVKLPAGFWATSSYAVPGPNADTKYIVIDQMHMFNQSRTSPLNVDYKDFVLRSDGYGSDDGYHVDRKETAALVGSLSETVLGPGQGQSGSLAFLVPAGMRRATLWYYVIQFDANYPSY